MECGHDEYRCFSLSSGDLQLLQSGLLYSLREDEEAVDWDSESSSSDSCDDLEDTQDFDFDFLEIHASEKTRVEKFKKKIIAVRTALVVRSKKILAVRTDPAARLKTILAIRTALAVRSNKKILGFVEPEIHV